MAIAMKGLRVRPQYEELIGVVFSDGLDNVTFHNRDASHFEKGFRIDYIVSQLDGVGAREMQLQQETASKQTSKEHLFKQIAINTGSNLSYLRNHSEADLRTERVNQALNLNTQFCNISRSNHEMETTYSLLPSDETEIRDDMSTRTIPRSETTWLPSLSRSSAMSDVAHQSSAVADISDELERQRQIAEHERQQQEIRQTRHL